MFLIVYTCDLAQVIWRLLIIRVLHDTWVEVLFLGVSCVKVQLKVFQFTVFVSTVRTLEQLVIWKQIETVLTAKLRYTRSEVCMFSWWRYWRSINNLRSLIYLDRVMRLLILAFAVMAWAVSTLSNWFTHFYKRIGLIFINIL